ncbi:MAG: hypothetical protein GF409_00245 [Candidatus Omnitrophica bacterium]|nr:hypothetical protein [Candidatus Omnitrophota bacterium]
MERLIDAVLSEIYHYRHIMLLPLLLLLLFFAVVMVWDRGALNVPVVYAGF